MIVSESKPFWLDEDGCWVCRGIERSFGSGSCVYHSYAEEAVWGYGLMTLPKLRETREELGLVVEDVARMANLAPFTIESLEEGRRMARRKTAAVLASVLGVRLSDLGGTTL